MTDADQTQEEATQAADESMGGYNDLPPAEDDGNPPPKKKKRRALEEPGGLTINSLLDIMTIILVFLLKSYSNNPVQLKQSDDLKLPFSSSTIMPTDSTAVTVTVNNIIVDEEEPILIDDGAVPEQDLSSGGFLIDPLYQKLQDAVDHQKKVASYNDSADFKGIVTIIADRHIDFDLLSKVMYTAGQAQFSKFKFAVIKGG